MVNKKFEIPEGAVIEKIEDGQFNIKGESICTSRIFYQGLCITTNKGDIKLLIDDCSHCCEYWEGFYFDTPDDKSSFIGAKILKVKEIEICLDRILGEPRCGEYRFEKQLRIETDKGDIQYAVYNSQNGFYAHATILQVFDSKEILEL